VSVASASVLRVQPLSVVQQGDDYLVGDPKRSEYVVLPEIGVVVIDLLRSAWRVN